MFTNAWLLVLSNLNTSLHDLRRRMESAKLRQAFRRAAATSSCGNPSSFRRR